MKYKFEWDEEKNLINKLKHDIAFEEATTVFDDTRAVVLYDYEHSGNEDRFNIIGVNEEKLKLTVCHCYRGENEDVVRIISAREATKKEIKIYYGGF